MIRSTRLVALLPLVAVTVYAPAVWAQEPAPAAAAPEGAHAEGHVEVGGHVEGASGESKGEAKEGAEAKEEGEEAEEAKGFELGLDAVFGFGEVPAINQSQPDVPGTSLNNRLESTKVQSDSYVIGMGYWLTDHFRIGARIPLVHGSLKPGGNENPRGVSALGNIEVGAEYELELTKSLRLVPGLGIALPTSIGDELPAGSDSVALATDSDGHDRFSVLQAASASRGFEDSALFESKRLAIIPELALELHTGKIQVVPFVKMENLIATSSNPKNSYLGEVVAGVRFAYAVRPWIDLGFRSWLVGAFDKEEKPGNVTAVLEPQVRMHFGPISPAVGLLIPIAPTSVDKGEEVVFDPRFIALRLAVGAHF